MKRTIRLLLLIAVVCYACEDDQDNYTSTLPGSWFCEENSSQYGAANYYIEISRSTLSDDVILFGNFYHLGTGITVSAKIEHSSIEITTQTVSGFTISGTGTVSDGGNKINLSFTADDNGDMDHVSAVLTRH